MGGMRRGVSSNVMKHPPYDPGLDEALLEFVARRTADLPADAL